MRDRSFYSSPDILLTFLAAARRAWLSLSKLPRVTFLLLMCTPLSSIAAVDILIVRSNSSDVYQTVDDSIQSNYYPACVARHDGCPVVKWWSVDLHNKQLLQEKINDKPGLVVTLGGKAALWIAEHAPPLPVIFTLIPRQTFESIEPDLPDGMQYSALFLDQPLDRQFKMMKYALPDRNRVGVLLGPLSSKLKQQLIQVAEKNDFSLNIEVVNNEKSIGRALRRLLDVSDVLFSVPDPLVYNRRSIFSILLTTYHSRTPVVGFSKAYVKAGALMALYSSPEHVGQHTAEAIADYFHDSAKHVIKHEYPRYFSIATNTNVARSLEIDLPDPEKLITQLKSAAP